MRLHSLCIETTSQSETSPIFTEHSFAAFIHNTDPGSICGFPGINIPLGRVVVERDTCCVGLGMDGAPGNTNALATHFEPQKQTGLYYNKALSLFDDGMTFFRTEENKKIVIT